MGGTDDQVITDAITDRHLNPQAPARGATPVASEGTSTKRPQSRPATQGGPAGRRINASTTAPPADSRDLEAAGRITG